MMTFREFCKLHKIYFEDKETFKQYVGIHDEEIVLRESEWLRLYENFLGDEVWNG